MATLGEDPTRLGIFFFFDAQGIVDSYAEKLKEFGFGDTTTEVKLLSETDSAKYYLAEDEHQQYLYKVPNGYCPHHSTGVKCD